VEDRVIAVVVDKVLFSIPRAKVEKWNVSVDVTYKAADKLGIRYPTKSFKVVREHERVG
jgi:hypothetical protein